MPLRDTRLFKQLGAGVLFSALLSTGAIATSQVRVHADSNNGPHLTDYGSLHIKYVDVDSGRQVTVDSLNGRIGQTVKLNSDSLKGIPAGYSLANQHTGSVVTDQNDDGSLVAKKQTPESVKISNNSNAEVTVFIKSNDSGADYAKRVQDDLTSYRSVAVTYVNAKTGQKIGDANLSGKNGDVLKLSDYLTLPHGYQLSSVATNQIVDSNQSDQNLAKNKQNPESIKLSDDLDSITIYLSDNDGLNSNSSSDNNNGQSSKVNQDAAISSDQSVSHGSNSGENTSSNPQDNTSTSKSNESNSSASSDPIITDSRADSVKDSSDLTNFKDQGTRLVYSLLDSTNNHLVVSDFKMQTTLSKDEADQLKDIYDRAQPITNADAALKDQLNSFLSGIHGGRVITNKDDAKVAAKLLNKVASSNHYQLSTSKDIVISYDGEINAFAFAGYATQESIEQNQNDNKSTLENNSGRSDGDSTVSNDLLFPKKSKSDDEMLNDLQNDGKSKGSQTVTPLHNKNGSDGSTANGSKTSAGNTSTTGGSGSNGGSSNSSGGSVPNDLLFPKNDNGDSNDSGSGTGQRKNAGNGRNTGGGNGTNAQRSRGDYGSDDNNGGANSGNGANQGTLPQTSNDNSKATQVLGLAALGLLGATGTGLYVRRKRS